MCSYSSVPSSLCPHIFDLKTVSICFLLPKYSIGSPTPRLFRMRLCRKESFFFLINWVPNFLTAWELLERRQVGQAQRNWLKSCVWGIAVGIHGKQEALAWVLQSCAEVSEYSGVGASRKNVRKLTVSFSVWVCDSLTLRSLLLKCNCFFVCFVFKVALCAHIFI